MANHQLLNCEQCPIHDSTLQKLGLNNDSWDFVVALAGNPNTGKSTIFNALTGLRQHTGNWPGKTVTRMEGAFSYENKRYKIVDLPGTYSLLSTSTDEEIARNFILFGRPDVTVIVVDATRLERNLNLVLQILEITNRAVICLNLMDEAKRHQLEIDSRRLSKELGVPVVPTVARQNLGIQQLLRAIHEVASGQYQCRPHRLRSGARELKTALRELVEKIETHFPGLNNARWVALRLLEGDPYITEALRTGELAGSYQTDSQFESNNNNKNDSAVDEIIHQANNLRWEIGDDLHDSLVEAIYQDAAQIADRVVRKSDESPRFDWERRLDNLLTNKWTGFPIMLLILAVVFWLTIVGANFPSSLLANLLIDTIHPSLKTLAANIHMPTWLSGLLFDGMYLSMAWVVSVMLPPMAIFFPLFTLLEDFGYLPRVAFNLDHIFKRVGAHGKQALTMAMGYGCNAAGVIATRIIDSPRERLIAIITNNFSLCNGRWPTQILIATLFIGSMVPPALAGLVSAAAVVGVALLGVFLTFLTSWFLSRTLLRGETSSFSLELPPYRPPRILQTLYTSLISRTIIVLWRAVIFAIPAGAVIWLSANIHLGDLTIAEHIIKFLNPFGLLIGLNGVILLAYIVAIPANEIVIPTILMLTVLSAKLSGYGHGAGVMFELNNLQAYLAVFKAGGWTLLTAINLMLFSLVHNPCSTTIFTIYKETGSKKWTAIAVFLPILMGFMLCFLVAQIWRFLN